VGSGAFRPYQHPSTQQCLQDIMDGYFPSELQPRYPDGVPLQVSATRTQVFFHQSAGWCPQQGEIEVCGAVQVCLGKREAGRSTRGTWHLPWGCAGTGCSPCSADTHLLWLQGSDGQRSSKEILVETPGLAALERYRYTEGAKAPGPDFCTLRIRSESGEQMYEVKMLLTDTIGDLRQHLAHIRGGNSDSYEIISTFPQRVYTDNSRSLQECGLVPSASLLLRRRDPSQQEGMGLSAQGGSCLSPSPNLPWLENRERFPFQI
uniref:UBX domain-containing protein 11 n=1 Tax=Corvus moneduloides TaxID=1196302 RepID=A0A8U7N5M4_CORMO